MSCVRCNLPFDSLELFGRLADEARQMEPDRVVTVAAVLHLGDRIFDLPVLAQDAIERAHRARAVRTVLAMDKYRDGVRVIHDREECLDLFDLGIPGCDLNPLRRKREATDLVRIRMVVAQIDDRLHAKRDEIGHPLRRRLGAPVELRVNAVQVGEPRPLHLLGPRNRTLRGDE